MGFTIPNTGDAAFIAQAEPDSGDFQILRDAFNNTYVVSGCLVDEAGSPNMSVDVASGQVMIGGSVVTVAGGNTAIGTANGTNDRIDLVTINSGGTVVVTAGSPAAAPVYPTIPASSVVIAAVYVPASDTAITNNQIIDKRVIRELPFVDIIVGVTGETASLTVGTNKFEMQAQRDFTITKVKATVRTAPTGSGIQVDINKNGTSIFSTPITIDAGSDTSVGAGTPYVISTAGVAEDDEITIDIDAIGSTVAGAGLKVYILGVVA